VTYEGRMSPNELPNLRSSLRTAQFEVEVNRHLFGNGVSENTVDLEIISRLLNL
jgi:hypothetical protein